MVSTRRQTVATFGIAVGRKRAAVGNHELGEDMPVLPEDTPRTFARILHVVFAGFF